MWNRKSDLESNEFCLIAFEKYWAFKLDLLNSTFVKTSIKIMNRIFSKLKWWPWKWRNKTCLQVSDFGRLSVLVQSHANKVDTAKPLCVAILRGVFLNSKIHRFFHNLNLTFINTVNLIKLYCMPVSDLWRISTD